MIDFHVGEETMPSELLDLSGLQRSIDLACAEIDRLRAINAELLAALKDAVGALEIFHGIHLHASVAAEAWRLYQNSPEMLRINAALAKAEDR